MIKRTGTSKTNIPMSKVNGKKGGSIKTYTIKIIKQLNTYNEECMMHTILEQSRINQKNIFEHLGLICPSNFNICTVGL